MKYFQYQSGEFYGELTPLAKIAETYGSPCYVYSKQAILDAYSEFAKALQSYPHPHQINYAVKANSNLAILNLLAQQGSGFDIVSEGELERVLKAGGKANKIVFSGVGKSTTEITQALTRGIGCINVESAAELLRLNHVAEQLNIPAKIAIRVNPDVAADSHPYISTGLKENKFGVHINQALELFQTAKKLSHIQIEGIAFHIGSQITSLAPFSAALNKVLLLIDSLNSVGISLKHIDVGGGLGVRYSNESPPTPKEYVENLIQLLKNRNLEIHIEPGRAIVADAGVLLTRVEYLKDNFAIVDASMNDLLRPALYESFHEIVAVRPHTTGIQNMYEIVGPVCETSDFLGKGRNLCLAEGDLLAVLSSGAYGFSMSSNYNSRPRAAEIMIDNKTFHLVRPREQLKSLFESEKVLD
jgi:diaminopimelate decarboxylase